MGCKYCNKPLWNAELAPKLCYPCYQDRMWMVNWLMQLERYVQYYVPRNKSLRKNENGT